MRDERYEVAIAEIARLRSERDEALAQVAVLLQRLREEHCQSETCDLHTAPFAEARALLDRLQQLQHTVDSLKPLQDRLRNHPLRGESDSLVGAAIKVIDRLQRVEDERASLAEDCGEMRKQITRQLVQLRQSEAVVRGVLQAAHNLVAAWDAGKERK